MNNNLNINYENIENKIVESIKENNWGFLVTELPEESILVGGYIRDLLMGNRNQLLDIDIVRPSATT